MEVEQPLISIIIPTLNRARQLKVTLNSIINQSYSNWECLMIDDGSTDDTYAMVHEFIKKDSRFKYYQRPDTHLKGGNGARNYGLTKSKGTYIQWFDSDDLMYPDCLETQLRSLQTSQAQFSLCLYDLFSERTNQLKVGQPLKIKDDFYLDYITKSLPANLPTILFKKTSLSGFYLNESLLKSQEYEFLQRFFRAYKDHGTLVNKSLIKVIRHQDSITEQPTPEKMASALDALLITILELPKESSASIKKTLVVLYLKTLYITFTERMTSIYYPYLIKTPKFNYLKSLITIAYLGLLYILVYILPLGNWHYKYIYNLYR